MRVVSDGWRCVRSKAEWERFVASFPGNIGYMTGERMEFPFLARSSDGVRFDVVPLAVARGMVEWHTEAVLARRH